MAYSWLTKILVSTDLSQRLIGHSANCWTAGCSEWRRRNWAMAWAIHGCALRGFQPAESLRGLWSRSRFLVHIGEPLRRTALGWRPVRMILLATKLLRGLAMRLQRGWRSEIRRRWVLTKLILWSIDLLRMFLGGENGEDVSFHIHRCIPVLPQDYLCPSVALGESASTYFGNQAFSMDTELISTLSWIYLTKCYN